MGRPPRTRQSTALSAPAVRDRVARDLKTSRGMHRVRTRLPALLLFAPALLAATSALADPVVDMEVGGEHECTVNACGSVQCWGDYNQFFGEDMDLGGDFDDVAVGTDHTCALAFDDDAHPEDGGDVVCWGRSPTDAPQSNEEWDLLAAPPEKFKQIDGGHFLTCGVLANDKVDCWGWDSTGAATGEPDNYFAQVSASYGYACGVTSGHNGIYCWGDAPLGLKELLIWDVPERWAGEKWEQVSAGVGHVCARTSAPTLQGGMAHRLYCWGENSAEQVNPPHPIDPDYTVATELVLDGEEVRTIYRHPNDDVLDVSAGTVATCAVIDGFGTNEIQCWGYPFTPYGLGLTTWGNPSHEPPLPAGFDPDRVFLHFHNLCAIDDDSGEVQCWSTDFYNVLGEVDPDAGMCI